MRPRFPSPSLAPAFAAASAVLVPALLPQSALAQTLIRRYEFNGVTLGGAPNNGNTQSPTPGTPASQTATAGPNFTSDTSGFSTFGFDAVIGTYNAGPPSTGTTAATLVSSTTPNGGTAVQTTSATNSAINLRPNGNASLILPNTFTVFLFARLPNAATSTNSQVLFSTQGTLATNGFSLLVNTSGSSDRRIIANTANASGVVGSASSAAGAFSGDGLFHSVAAVVTKGTGAAGETGVVQLFFDGVALALEDNTIRNDYNNDTGGARIAQTTATNNQTTGTFDDFQLYNGALTATQVSNLNQGLALNGGGTVAPEPGTLALLASTGFAGLLSIARRRRGDRFA